MVKVDFHFISQKNVEINIHSDFVLPWVAFFPSLTKSIIIENFLEFKRGLF